MTTNAMIVMTISVGTIITLFLFCIVRVLISPAPESED